MPSFNTSSWADVLPKNCIPISFINSSAILFKLTVPSSDIHLPTHVAVKHEESIPINIAYCLSIDYLWSSAIKDKSFNSSSVDILAKVIPLSLHARMNSVGYFTLCSFVTLAIKYFELFSTDIPRALLPSK